MNRIIVRFKEFQSYDIQSDAEVVRFLATTSSGTFWCDVGLEGPRSLRNDRQAFKEQVVELIQAGARPQYVALDSAEH